MFLHAVMAKKRKMQIRCRDMEWWMKRRQLPSRLRQRVRRFERQRWTALGGEDELELIQDLPPGLRRDIKRYLCFDLINKVLGSKHYSYLVCESNNRLVSDMFDLSQVPLFRGLDDLILDNICDRAKPRVFSKDEKVLLEPIVSQNLNFQSFGIEGTM